MTDIKTAELNSTNSMILNDREAMLDQWVSDSLSIDTSAFTRNHLSGDASFRRYYRIVVNKPDPVSYILMDAPPPESPETFVNVANILDNHGLIVPKVFAKNYEHGFLLLSDFGDTLYLKNLNSNTVNSLYQNAIQVLLKLNQCKAEVPAFDDTFLLRQLGFFEDWYLEKHLKMPKEIIESQKESLLIPIYDQLLNVINSQPQVFVHRDFHSRNLMILPNDPLIKNNTFTDENIGILDFQDAMMGPITYDLVSLLQDCYISWPRTLVEEFILQYKNEAMSTGLITSSISDSNFIRWFDWTGLQRHLKNLGIFARLLYRDGKSGYIKDIPQVLKYVEETCTRYQELTPLWTWLEKAQLEMEKDRCAQ